MMRPYLEALSKGEIVAMPTETVYGLAGDATQTSAVEKIYRLKGRPSFNPLIVHVSDIAMAASYAVFSETAFDVVRYFWIENPLPLTLVLPLKKDTSLSPLVTAGLTTVAIRRPSHPLALSLIEQHGKPLAAPSANLSNTLSPTHPQMIRKQFPDLLILDGGSCAIGVESTILDAQSFEVLRPGGCTQEDLEIFLKKRLSICTHPDVIRAPGQMSRHYAPTLPLRINVEQPYENEAFVTFGKGKIPFSLSPSGNLLEAAACLFSTLWAIEERGEFQGIAVMPIPYEGLGVAINDRLRRAAAQEKIIK